jgi:hypothetical protein
MSGIQKLMISGKEILSIDYSDLKENEIIKLASEISELVRSDNKNVLVLCIFNDKNYITPKIMRHMEAETGPLVHLVNKMALIGLSPVKKVILKGYNLFLKRNFVPFDTRDEAISYLLDN